MPNDFFLLAEEPYRITKKKKKKPICVQNKGKNRIKPEQTDLCPSGGPYRRNTYYRTALRPPWTHL